MTMIDINQIFTTVAGQAVTSATTTTSTDAIDLSPLTAPNAAGATNTFRDIGTGDNVYLEVKLLTGSVTTVTTPTVTINVQTADDTGFSTNLTTVMSTPAIALPITTAAATAGVRLFVGRLPTNLWRRYVRVQFVTGGTITTASYTFYAGFAMNTDAGFTGTGGMPTYADAITIQ